MSELSGKNLDPEICNFCHSIGVTGIGQQIALMRFIDGVKADRVRHLEKRMKEIYTVYAGSPNQIADAFIELVHQEFPNNV